MTSSILKESLQSPPKENVISGLNQDPLLPSPSLYKEFMVYILQVILLLGTPAVPFIYSFTIILYCAHLNLSAKTVYLAKLYLDIVISKYNFTDPNHLSKFCLCSLWMAIKFNEPDDISQYFDAEMMCSQSLSAFQASELLDIEAKILNVLQSKLDYSTPYDYFQIFFSCYSFFLPAQSSLKSIIELSCIIFQLRKESCLNIFYGSLMAICKLKNINFQIFKNQLIHHIQLELHKIEMISCCIIQRYNQILNEDIEENHLAQQAQAV